MYSSEYFEEDTKIKNEIKTDDIDEREDKVKYPCDKCGKQFSQKSSLKRHIQSLHERVKYSCDNCNKEFTLKDALKKHIQSIHERIKHSCLECGKEFSQHVKSTSM